MIRKEEAIRQEYTIQSALDEEVDVVSYPYLTREYNAAGLLLKECTRDHAGGIHELLEYRYDAAGRKTETRNYFDEEEISETIYHEYNDAGQLIRERRVYADGSESVTEFRYNIEGQPIEKQVTNEEDEIEEIERWRYSEGREVWYERREYDEPVFREEQEYDREGRVVVITLWEGDTDQTSVHKIFYHDDNTRHKIEKYNDAGQKVAVLSFDRYENDQPLEVTETTVKGSVTTRYAYNDEGMPVLIQVFDDRNLLINEIVRVYNEEGLLISIEETADRQGSGMNLHYRIEYRYEFFE